MRTEYEGRETAVRVCSCRFILEMVGFCYVPKVASKHCFSDFATSWMPKVKDLFFLRDARWRVVVLLLESNSSLAADGSHDDLLEKFKRCGFTKKN